MLKSLWGDLRDIWEDLKVIKGAHANNPKGLGLPVLKNSNDLRYFFCHCALIDLLLLKLASFVTHESMSGDLMIGVQELRKRKRIVAGFYQGVDERLIYNSPKLITKIIDYNFITLKQKLSTLKTVKNISVQNVQKSSPLFTEIQLQKNFEGLCWFYMDKHSKLVKGLFTLSVSRGSRLLRWRLEV